ncbi:hypothetical protein V6667_09225 [Neisseria leonii]|uniref:Lipoprotein n=1 Tax=Neisseria leonii TaxID=2995413 RepID=A0A9X4E352_9NEIS|nr:MULTISPECIES: hypothetical protein [unclassified Neisseria]MDD9325718.1 hypothetical protein [Neisseria sp. 3986]MDD9327859.1 hypothetical protein [Neisseria sp. 51.81]
MGKQLLPAALCLLAACAVLPQKREVPPLARSGWFQLTQYRGAETAVQSLLAVEPGAEGVRFVQTDALGVPQTRQIFGRRGWRNDGFVMPDAGARRLFTALLPLLAADGAAVFPQWRRQADGAAACYYDGAVLLWCSRPADGGWRIDAGDGVGWLVRPLEE